MQPLNISVSSISPASGPTSGGTSVTITGNNFGDNVSVDFGNGNPATNVDRHSSTEITCTSPSGSGTVSVIVDTSNGNFTLSNAFTYVAAPTVTSISPTSGPAAGGTSVTITGTGFTGTTGVKIGGAAATGVSVVNSTTITATTPAGTAGTASVLVTTPGGTNAANTLFTYVGAPTVSSISPIYGPVTGGTPVTITGTNLANATAVDFGSNSATITADTSTSIAVTSPAGTAGEPVAVTVTTVGGTSSVTHSSNLEESPQAFTYYAFSPTSGSTAGGAEVTINGADFGASPSDFEVGSVKFGSTSATNLTRDSDTEITCDAPAGTGPVQVYVVYNDVGESDNYSGKPFDIGTFNYEASVLTSNLTLSGNPVVTYNNPGQTYSLPGTFTLSGDDQFGNPMTVDPTTATWEFISGPASLNGDTLTLTGAGTVVVTATVGSLTSNQGSITVNQGARVLTTLNLTSSGPVTETYEGSNLTYTLPGDFTLSGTDQFGVNFDLTGQTITWVVVTGPATVSGDTLTITGSGTVVFTASIGNVTSNTADITVNQGTPVLKSLTLSGSPSLTYEGVNLTYGLPGDFTLSGLDQFGAVYDLTNEPITWVVTSGPATVTGDSLTITGSGSVVIEAQGVGPSVMSPITSNTADITVNQGTPVLKSLTLSGSPSLTYEGVNLTYGLPGDFTLSGLDQFGAVYDLTNEPITWVVTSGPATVTGDSLTITGSGSVVIEAQGVGPSVMSPITSNTADITVNQGTPVLKSLTLSGSPSLTYEGVNLTYGLPGDFTLSGLDQFGAVYDLTNEPITWVVTSGPATVTGDSLTITGSGSVVIEAQGVGPSVMSPITSNTADITVNQGTPVLKSLTLSGSPSLTYEGVNLTYGLPGDFTLSGLDQFGAVYDLTNEPITWVVTSGPATVTGDSLTITGSGSVVIEAQGVGPSVMSPITSNTADITVNQGTPVLKSLTLSGSPSLTYEGVNLTYGLPGDFTLSGLDQFGAVYDLTNEPITWVVTSGPATVTGDSLTITGSGSVVIEAQGVGPSVMSPITSNTADITVNQGTPVLKSLTLSGSPSLTYEGVNLTYGLPGDFTLSGLDQFGAVYDLTNEPITWVVTSGPATVTGDSLTITGSGSVVIEAQGVGPSVMSPITSNTADITVNQGTPVLKSLTLSGSPSLTYEGVNLTYGLPGDFTLSGLDQFGAVYDLTNEPITWVVTSGPATVTGDSLTITGSGSVVIEAQGVGPSVMSPITSNTADITVNQGTPVLKSLTLSGSPSLTYEGVNLTYGLPGDFTLSGLDQFGAVYDLTNEPITWVVTSGPATVTGDSLTITGSGSVVIEAQGVGPSVMSPITSNTADITVNQGTPVLKSLTLSGSPSLTYEGVNLTYGLPGDFTLSGLDQFGAVYDLTNEPITWVVTSGPATVTGDSLTITGSGSVVIEAQGVGPSVMSPITSNTADITVNQGTPTVTSISPISGPAVGGTAVTITGTNLTGATAVYFGTTAATSFTVVSDTSITATSPAGTAGTVDVTVTTAGGTSATSSADQFTYVAAPTVSSVVLDTGSTAGGSTVTITGTSFTGATAVYFGTTAATSFNVVSDTSITATSPAGTAGTVDVTVTTAGGTSATSSADQFTYTTTTTAAPVGGGGGGSVLPIVTSVSPDTGSTAGGTTVTINGDNLTGATAVDFGTTPATSFTVNSNGTITATSPAEAAGTVNVFVTEPGGTSSVVPADQFTYTVPAPAPVMGAIFTDVPNTFWAYADIENLAGLGYATGYSDGTFRPNSQITRAEFCAIMDKVLNVTTFTQQTPTFTDVNTGDWFYQAVEEAVYAGIAKGYNDGTFRPNAPISRQEIACVLVQALGKSQLADSNAQAVTTFGDDHDIAWWSRGYIYVALQQNIVSGYTDNSFDPGRDGTRAEACAMISNFLKAYSGK